VEYIRDKRLTLQKKFFQAQFRYCENLWVRC